MHFELNLFSFPISLYFYSYMLPCRDIFKIFKNMQEPLFATFRSKPYFISDSCHAELAIRDFHSFIQQTFIKSALTWEAICLCVDSIWFHILLDSLLWVSKLSPYFSGPVVNPGSHSISISSSCLPSSAIILGREIFTRLKHPTPWPP